MMSLCGNWTALLLFLCASPAVHFHLFAHAATSSPPATRSGIKYTAFDFDYDDDGDDSSDVVSQKRTTVLQHRPPPRPCQHDPCAENQEPCESLAKQHGCLCPGVSRADEPPHSPRIQALKPITTGAGSGKIEVQWCAPSSVVQKYRVVIEGEGDSLEFKDVSRSGLIRSVEVGTKVCVEAVNNAGSSSPSEFSCMRFTRPESSDHKLLFGIIAGGVALLVLIVAAVVFWKCRMSKKAKADSTDGLGNPSYSTEGTL